MLRRGPAGLEVIANGVFLVSAANAASSRALVQAAWPYVRGDALDVLIGGLGIGDALDEALACERVAAVTVAELEPVIVRWFREHGGEAARRAAEAEPAGRARVVVGDVAGLLDEPARWDVVALDTDNGPEWLVRGENAGLYAPAGLRRVSRGAPSRAASPCSGRPTATRCSRATSRTRSTGWSACRPSTSSTDGRTSTPCTSPGARTATSPGAG